MDWVKIPFFIYFDMDFFSPNSFTILLELLHNISVRSRKEKYNTSLMRIIISGEFFRPTELQVMMPRPCHIIYTAPKREPLYKNSKFTLHVRIRRFLRLFSQFRFK